MTERKEELCRKLRISVLEFGQDEFQNAFIVGNGEYSNISDIPYYFCATISIDQLGGVKRKIAMFFDDL